MAITRLNSLAIPAGTIVESDLSYPLTNFSSTGIDDNATSTAITIDSAGKVGVGTASPNRNLTVSSTFPVIQLLDSDNGLGQTGNDGLLIYQSGANANISNEYAGSLQLGTSGGVRVAIDSSGKVGIGTLSPGEKLDVDGTIQVINGNQGLAAQIYTDSAGNMNLLADHGDNGGGDHIFRNGSAGTELVRILNTGNVGIGTSSPNSNIADGIDCNSTLYGRYDFTSGVPSTGLGMVCTADGNVTGFSSGDLVLQCRPGVNSRSIRFFTGNTSTERMQIDASGNVGIGTTSPSSKLSLIASSVNGLHLGQQSDNTANSSRLFFDNSTNIWTAYSTAGNFKIASGATIGSSSGTDRLVIDSSGNVGIGETAPLYKLDINGANTSGIVDVAAFTNPVNAAGTGHGARIRLHATQNAGRGVAIASSSNVNYATDNDMLFYTSASSTLTERVRINSLGHLLVGTSTAMGGGGSDGLNGFGAQGIGGGRFVVIQNQTDANMYLAKNSGYSNNTFVWFYVTGSQVGSIVKSGSGVAYNTTSDQRLKENIVDAPAGNIDAIRVRSFDWKADGSHQTYGMVAQELVDVAPEAVTQGETEEDMWQVDYSKLVPMMIKEIQDLKAEVAALKGA